jgi:hypothetical protein
MGIEFKITKKPSLYFLFLKTQIKKKKKKERQLWVGGRPPTVEAGGGRTTPRGHRGGPTTVSGGGAVTPGAMGVAKTTPNEHWGWGWPADDCDHPIPQTKRSLYLFWNIHIFKMYDQKK